MKRRERGGGGKPNINTLSTKKCSSAKQIQKKSKYRELATLRKKSHNTVRRQAHTPCPAKRNTHLRGVGLLHVLDSQHNRWGRAPLLQGTQRCQLLLAPPLALSSAQESHQHRYQADSWNRRGGGWGWRRTVRVKHDILVKIVFLQKT